MSLEDALNENTAAIKELSLIMAGIKGTPANDTGNTTDKPQKVLRRPRPRAMLVLRRPRPRAMLVPGRLKKSITPPKWCQP